MKFLYIHIWASDEEIRVQCTDPPTLKVLVRHVKENFSDCRIENREDLREELYSIRIAAMQVEKRHQKIAWWLFKFMCEHGWEPMMTGENWYKLLYSGSTAQTNT